MDGILQKSDLVLVLISFCLPVTPFLLTGMPNDGYAMYVWRSGYDPSVFGCDVNEFLHWNKNSPCFTHTWKTPEKRTWLWSTCNVPGRRIQKIFLADVYHKLRDSFNTKSCTSSDINLLKQTIDEGHTHVSGLQIYALFAVSDINVSEKDMVKYVVWYNDHCAATNEKFDGVAVNNEAYSHIKCHSGDVEQRKYLQNLNMIKTEAMKQLHGHLLTHFSVGYHWGHCGGTPKMITYNGKSQEATRHMIDIFDSVDVQVAYTIFPPISDRLKMAGYQYAVDTGKQIYATFYTNKADPCQTSFFPTPCHNRRHTETEMMHIIDNFSNHGIEHAHPCIHYFRGIYSSGGNPDWPKH